ncbi:hypothetical protein Efla_000770 [Eimeria flavescens]
MSRPEHLLPADVFYGEEESQKYARSSRMQKVQRQLAERALEMLLLPEDESALVLDLGFGCGMSGSVVSEKGHFVVGLDISRAMLYEAQDLENTYNTDSIQADLGKPFYFRPGSFDGAISISAIQWLCSDIKSDVACGVETPEAAAAAAAAAAADSGEGSSEEEQMDEDGEREEQLLQQQLRRRQLRPTPPASAYRRQTCFFQHLARALRPGARAALQFYPDNAEQLESLTSAALRSGFEGGLVVDYPNSTKAKKYFLCLWLPGGGRQKPQQMPKALGTSAILNAGRERPAVSGRRAKKQISKREWIVKKKEQQKLKGKKVRPQSNVTAAAAAAGQPSKASAAAAILAAANSVKSVGGGEAHTPL